MRENEGRVRRGFVDVEVAVVVMVDAMAVAGARVGTQNEPGLSGPLKFPGRAGGKIGGGGGGG